MPATRPTLVKAADIIVGVDGSPGADAALAWALEEARVRGSEVEAVVARSMRVASREHLSYDQLTPAHCEHLLEETLARIGGQGGVPLRPGIRDDGMLFELCLEATARGAGLIVVGAAPHGRHGPLHGPLVPTPRPWLTHRLRCPLVTVPPDFVRRPTRRILVIPDPAGDDLGALRWAVGESVLTGATLEVVSPGCTRSGHRPGRTDLYRRVEEILASCWLAGIDAALLPRQGQLSQALRPADLLVVDIPARHWRQDALTSWGADPRALLAGMPVVLVPAGAV